MVEMKTREIAKHVAALAIAGLASSMALGGSAQAAPIGHEHYGFVETGTTDECGVLVDYEWTGSGNAFVREVNGSDGQAYLGHDNYSFRTVITNSTSGAWMVVRGKSLFTEIAGTHVEGNIWEFTQHEAGQPFVIEDSTGTVLARSRGLVTYRLLFDTLGDGQPGGEVLDVEVTGVHGVQQGTFDDNLCDFVVELLG